MGGARLGPWRRRGADRVRLSEPRDDDALEVEAAREVVRRHGLDEQLVDNLGQRTACDPAFAAAPRRRIVKIIRYPSAARPQRAEALRLRRKPPPL